MELGLMSNTNQMPKEEGIDHSLSLLREGYMYISNRCRSFNSNIFETRLLGKKAICMVGKEAAEVFYDTEKFKRRGAAPNRVVQTLFGKNGVQVLDGQSHKQRKEMFMSMMSHDALKKLTEMTKEQWEIAVHKWEQMEQVILYEEVQEIMCRTACQWAGVPVQEDEVKGLTKKFRSIVRVGSYSWSNSLAREKCSKLR
jgi:fatty-acid peroxygenase